MSVCFFFNLSWLVPQLPLQRGFELGISSMPELFDRCDFAWVFVSMCPGALKSHLDSKRVRAHIRLGKFYGKYQSASLRKLMEP